MLYQGVYDLVNPTSCQPRGTPRGTLPEFPASRGDFSVAFTGLTCIYQSINERLYLTSNLLIAKLLISPKKINL